MNWDPTNKYTILISDLLVKNSQNPLLSGVVKNLELPSYIKTSSTEKFSSKSKRVEVYADSFVALNGRPSQRFIDPNVNLYDEKESFKNKNWVLPLNDEIKGL